MFTHNAILQLQYYLLAHITTPTLHRISYAQCPLKIVFVWCKVRTKLDSLSLARSRWLFNGKAPSVLAALQKCSFARKSQYMPTEWVSDSKTEREGGFLSRCERLIGCHKERLNHIVLVPLFISCGLLCSCQMRAIIRQLSDLFKCDKIPHGSLFRFPLLLDILHKIQIASVWKGSPYLSAYCPPVTYSPAVEESTDRQNTSSSWKSA